MDQKFVEIDGRPICYFEQNAEATNSLFFIHGNSCSSRLWIDQFESQLLKKYRLVGIDLPGHGDSFRSNLPNEDYSPVGTAHLVANVIGQLFNYPPIFVGSSYGTNVIGELLSVGTNPVGIFLISPSILGADYGLDKIFKQSRKPSILLFNETNSKEIESFFRNELSVSEQAKIDLLIQSYQKTDTQFKPALFQTAEDGKISDEIHALQKIRNKIAVAFGENDNQLNIDYLDNMPFSVWRNTILKLPEAGHYVNIDRSEEINQLINEFAADVFR